MHNTSQATTQTRSFQVYPQNSLLCVVGVYIPSHKARGSASQHFTAKQLTRIILRWEPKTNHTDKFAQGLCGVHDRVAEVQ